MVSLDLSLKPDLIQTQISFIIILGFISKFTEKAWIDIFMMFHKKKTADWKWQISHILLYLLWYGK